MAAAARPELQQLPSVGRLLERKEVRDLCAQYGRAQTVVALRGEIGRLRGRLRERQGVDDELAPSAIAARLQAQLDARRAATLTSVINATGVVLHTNLGRAPLPRGALEAIEAVGAGYSNVEFDLELGERGSRTAHVEPLLCRLTGAEAAVVVNNGAAALLLALCVLARDGEVVASRGELIEIGGGFRLPEVIAQSGARLVEVGTTNRTRLADYERALSAATQVLLKSHTSNYRILGFSESVPLPALSALAHRHSLPLVEDLGSGTLVDLTRYGLPGEPTVGESVRAGADIVCFSGDKLLGGPQAGILVGRREWLEKLRRHPLMRALRIDKLTLAALCATLRIYESATAPEQQIPVLRMLSAPAADVRKRARRVLRDLRGLASVETSLSDDVSLPGGGSLPLATLPTTVLRLRHPERGCAVLARACLAQRPPVVGRVQDGDFCLDLRTVADHEVQPMLRSLRAALS